MVCHIRNLTKLTLESIFREKYSGMQNLIHSTVNGREVLRRIDLRINLLCGLFISVVTFAKEASFINEVYGLSDLKAPAISLTIYAGSVMPSIFSKLIVYYAIRIAAVEGIVALVTVTMRADRRLIVRR